MSDILRLLARSTSVSKAVAGPKPARPAAAPADAKPTSASKKRKRKHTSKGAGSVASTAATDAATQADKSTGKEDKSKKRKRDEVDGDEAVATNGHTTLAPAEVRSILKQHKLKYTILATLGSPEDRPKAHENEATEESASTEASEKRKKKDKKRKKQKESKEAIESADPPKPSKLNQIFPTPIQSFDELRTRYSISKRLHENVLAQRFVAPTEVQMGSLPLLLNEEHGNVSELDDCDVDVMTIAPTGSGKTLAYAIPAINHLIRTKHEQGDDYEKGIRVIVLSPTRELADQIVNEFRKLLLGTGIRVVGMKKSLIPKERRKTSHSARDAGRSNDDDDKDDKDDSDEEEDSEAEEEGSEDELASGSATSKGNGTSSRGLAVKSEIMVATPLLLLHAIQLCPDLFPVSKVTRIILDEADVLLDDLFLSQTTSIISHLTSPALSFSFWSATMPSTSETLATNLISRHPSALNSTKPRKLVRLIAGIKDSSLPTIRQTITYTASERGKLMALRQLFTTSLKTPCLIFLQTIPRAQALHAEILYDLPTPNRIAVLHSNLSETARIKVMDSFRAGEIWVLITTDLLSRGVDFRGVNLVINYDIPTSVASYIHRIGRTGRAGREGGMAITYYTEEDVKYVRGIVGVMEKSGGGEGIQKWMLDSLPKTSKEEKKELKKKGVKERRVGTGASGGENRKSRISTKSGYDRRVAARRKAAVDFSRRKKDRDVDSDDGSGSEWEGLE
ncbi:ATP-dependent RNA helicase rok1 [Drechslerella dactyloides]|uniref:RNA helicase n=1 Tax=Drechslerella dactyloides TaxID=74499 RepID=A0AAD6NMB9_DREDA|nr:ATP-dependent RNA helicase rok1 [Drechslerella dactyloides]